MFVIYSCFQRSYWRFRWNGVIIFFRFNYYIYCVREGFKKKKKCGIFRTLVGWVGLKKSFSAKKNMVSKCIKSPKYSFRINLFFSYWGVWHWIFMISKWQLDLPDLEIFSKYFGLFQWEKIILCQNAYFCLKMIFRPCYTYFFSY